MKSFIYVFTASTLLFLFGVVQANAAEIEDDSYAVTLLRQATIDSGYTLVNPAGTFELGVPPETIKKVKRARLRIRHVNKPERFPLGDEKLFGDLYKYKVGKGSARRIRLANKLWIKMSYPGNKVDKNKTLKYWDSSTTSWKRLKSSDDKDALMVRGGLKHKYAVLGVFAKNSQASGEVVQGQASWYDGVGAACNDFPLGSTIRTTNLATGAFVDSKVVSTGPFVTGRVVDLTREDFSAIANIGAGVVDVSIQRVEE